ncbi:short-subunit dehydrogenase [Virgibacillus natechei]|uniref:Short-subunit dehydrogenase n=1 Tax=Virgibacillus natechei TaxID=1216297 RepID=A0ABS4IFF4_9BACI|nr:SDR family oxidoreductase [Virgibacillus natechei]MBP1969674.1 short-subunit dehydrogenase [Virgibacillus natechei]UZD11401.1 SDR family oxidoreductase [Virgibacillus natechei]
MQKKVANKKIVVTGASSGIGKRIVWHIAKNGGIPIMLARSIDKLQTQQEQLDQELHAESFIYQVDLQDKTQIEAVMKQVLLEHNQIHGLINNAGFGKFTYVKDVAWQDVHHMFQLNVFALMNMTQLLLPHFSTHGGGHIVNIASQAGKISTPKSAIYASTKHAVLGFTNSLRLESKEINVTGVNLGPVRTNFFVSADPEGTYQKSVDRYMLDPDKVAQKIVRHMFTTKREINLPYWMEFGSKLYQLFPGLMEFVLRKQFNKK